MLLSLQAVVVTLAWGEDGLAAQPAPRVLGSRRDKKQPHPQRGPCTEILPPGARQPPQRLHREGKHQV